MSTLLTTSQAAAILGVCRREIRRLCAAGVLPATRVGRAWVIDEAAALSYVRRPRGRLGRTAVRVERPAASARALRARADEFWALAAQARRAEDRESETLNRAEALYWERLSTLAARIDGGRARK
jgi:excisionase family DNA binding protein